jgi:transcriptional regulator GlxA family with amidase domain
MVAATESGDLVAFPKFTMRGRLLRVRDWEVLAKEAKFDPSIMAALCPVSLRQLERFFEKQFNRTPTEWARELRCRIAVELISQGWSTKAVASELRFANESHFCHQFKRVLGSPPQAFAPIHGCKRRDPF